MKHFPTEVLRHHTAVLGKTGAGKTSTEKLIVEQVVADGARVCVLDALKSDWWGITSSASGKSAGLPFQILGGPRGHVPLHSSAGKVIGHLVGSGKLPLSIVDMADFEPGGIQRFFVDFAEALFRNVRGVVYLVIEEAHEVAPKERAGFGAENMAIHWAKKLATGSRTKGIKLIVATQRVQALHNAVLGSCETLITHRLTTPADKAPVIDWLKDNASKETMEQVRASLSSLPTGTGWICSGEAEIFEKVSFPKFRTFDNTATPDHDTVEIDVKMAPVDQDALRRLIGDEVSKAEADDPKKLRAENEKLRRQLAAQPGAAIVDEGAIRDATAAAYARGKTDGYADAIKAVTIESAAVLKGLEGARAAAAQLEHWSKQAPPSFAPAPAATASRAAQRLREARQTRREVATPKVSADGVDLPLSARKMLTVLDTTPPVRRTWVQTATLAGLKARGGSFNTAKKVLLESGLIRTVGSLIEIAHPSAAASAAAVSPSELIDMWCKNLSGSAPAILRTLFEGGGSMSQIDIASQLKLAARGGSWNTSWKELRDNKIVTVSAGQAELTELFQP